MPIPGAGINRQDHKDILVCPDIDRYQIRHKEPHKNVAILEPGTLVPLGVVL